MSESILLGEVAESQTGPFGSQLHEEDYVDEGTPIVTVEHLGELGFTTQNLPFVSEADVERLKKYTLTEGDIVFSRVGAIDRNTLVTENENGWLFSGRCIRVRCDKHKVNPVYLSYYFRLEHFKRMMLNVSVGATMPSLNTEIMDSLPLELVSRAEQDIIASCLSALGDKIRNNKAICADLEAMAKLVYDYWFVQFDFPDENGKPYKSSGGKMVWNEELKREIPDGWEVKPLLDVFAWIGTSQPPKSTFRYSPSIGYVRFIQNRDYDSEDHITYIPLTEGTRTCTEWDIMMDKYGDAGKVRFGIAGAYNVALSKISVYDPKMMEYIRAYLKSDFVYSYLHSACMASTRASLNEANFSFLSVPIPNNETLVAFNTFAKKCIEIQLELKSENQQLASLRDFLLPMLMNGQVKVGETKE